MPFRISSLLLISYMSFGPSVDAIASDASPAPDWQVEGVKAALRDPDPETFLFGTSEYFFPSILHVPAADLTPLLRQRLEHDGTLIRWSAAAALGLLGEYAAPAVQQLVNLLGDDDRDVRLSAAEALGGLGEHAAPAVPQLMELLADDGENIRVAAAAALGGLGEHAAPAVPRLVELLTDDDTFIGLAAAAALGGLGEHAAPAAPRLVELLTDDDRFVRVGAAEALGGLGEHAAPAVQQLMNLLGDDDRFVRRSAAEALGRLGEHAAPAVPQLVELLADDEDNRQYAAAVLGDLGKHAASAALGDLGEHAASAVPQLMELLTDDDRFVRVGAAEALGGLGEHAASAVQQLVDLMRDDDTVVGMAAAEALGGLGEHAAPAVPQLTELLADDGENIRMAAVKALDGLGEHAALVVPQLMELLADDDENIRMTAVRALDGLGEHAAPAVPQLMELLADDGENIRVAAAAALGRLGGHAAPAVLQLAKLLTEYDLLVSDSAAEALGRLGEHAAPAVPQLVELLTDADPLLRGLAEETLIALREHAATQGERVTDLINPRMVDHAESLSTFLHLGPLDFDLMPAFLARGYADTSKTGEARFLAHVLSGGNPNTQTLLKWIGDPEADPLERLGEDLDRAQRTLLVLRQAWKPSEPYRLLRTDLASKIARLVSHFDDWGSDDLTLLREHEEALRSARFTVPASAVQQQINVIEAESWTVLGGRVWAAHIAFWLLLIFAYPRSPQVQAIFFWNRTVRAIVGFGYVGFLLAWVPFLRRRLFAPFRDALVSDAQLSELREQDYFSGSMVRLPDATHQPVKEALADIRGLGVLIGESGLGKSMFLRNLVRRNEKLVIFLRARDCHHGVVEAIQAKLEGPARDPNYLRQLIYAGALDVVIDGLNEVSAGTRAGIVEFARRFSRGNLLMATQPMEWDPPPLAKNYVLQPLSDEQIEKFLLGRFEAVATASTCDPKAIGGIQTREEYADRCRAYLRGALSAEQPEKIRAAARQVLSNPMDLTVVAHMLAHGQVPDLFGLQQESYRLMAADYAQRHAGNVFPLAAFSERTYAMRLGDEPAFLADEFANELAVMARHKMVVPYHHLATDSDASPRITFRHDKVMDFFLVQAFVGPENERPLEHLGDPRFRGTYLQLASLLPLDAAIGLGNELVEFAADTRDHSVSDDFIQLLRPRKDSQSEVAESTKSQNQSRAAPCPG